MYKNRLMIIGPPGSGKSTLACKLGEILNLPVHHLDWHMLVPGNKKRDREEFLAIQKALVAEKAWIIEGCSTSTLEMRFARADTVIYLHPPRLLCIYRACKRFITQDSIDDAPDGCSRVFHWEMIRYIWNFDRDKGPLIDALRKQFPAAAFHEIRSTRDLKKYMEGWKHR